MRDGNPHQEDMRAAEKTIKGTAYAAAAFALLYVPCILAALLLPSPPTTSEKFSRTLIFNVMEDGTETMIAFGTPPKPTRMKFSGAECGIIMWGRDATESWSWVSASSDSHAYGADFVLAGGTRAFLPVRFVSSEDYHEFAGDDSLQGIIGICPDAVRSWGIEPAYAARCSNVAIGRAASSSDFALFPRSECGPAIETEIFDFENFDPGDPWAGAACIAVAVANKNFSGGGKWRSLRVGVDAVGGPVASRAFSPAAVARPVALPWEDYAGKAVRVRPHYVIPCRRDDENFAHDTDMTWENTISIPTPLPREITGAPPALGGVDCSSIGTLAEHGRDSKFPSKKFSVVPCVPCYRNRDGVVMGLFVVIILGSAWSALATTMHLTRLSATIVANAVRFSAACFYFSAAFGTGAGTTAAAMAIGDAHFGGRFAVEAAFFVAVAGVAACGFTYDLAIRVSSVKILRRKAGARLPEHEYPPVSFFERLTVEIPLCAAFWYAAYSQDNFFARMLVMIGASLMCSALGSAIAITSVLLTSQNLRTSAQWIFLCAAAGLVNLAAVWLAGLPVVGAFLGDSMAVRLTTASGFLVATGLPALLLATKRVDDIAEERDANEREAEEDRRPQSAEGAGQKSR